MTSAEKAAPRPKLLRWLNRTVLGIGLASLLSDWSHEIATAVMPAFLATLGVSAAWLGLIEGVADGVSSFAKLASGYVTDQLRRRKPIAVAGYMITALATAAIGLAHRAWHVLVCRVMAWFGRGIRTPVRKALLAASVTPETYGRAFGFERMMDTLGAIVGPATATLLVVMLGYRYRTVLLLSFIPGLLAAGAIGWCVREQERLAVQKLSFWGRIGLLPPEFRRMLVAVGVFGVGDFAHTMLILLATQRLSICMGMSKAATVAMSLYVLHNVFYAAFAVIAGWLADHFSKRLLLAGTYFLAAITGLLLLWGPARLDVFALIFVLGGVFVAGEEALEDSLAAELVPPEQHGMGFGMLATVNGIGDFVSSALVGFLWSTFGARWGFLYSTVVFTAGACLALRIPEKKQIGKAATSP